MDLSKTPAAPPPPGVTPNLVNPYSRSPMAVGVCSMILFLMVFFVLLRLYVKAWVVKALWFEDYVCIIATVLTVAWTGLLFGDMLGGGIGMHIWDVPLSAYSPTYFKRFTASVVIYTVTPFAVKLSIFLLLIRVFGTKQTFLWTMYFGIVINVIFALIAFIATTIWCSPKPGQSVELAVNSGNCQHKAELLSIYQAGFNMATDVYLLVTPMPVIFRLKVSLQRKLGIGAIFTTGFLATICSALTLWERIRIRHSVDPSWDWIPTQIVSVFELNVGIICACLPCLPILLKDGNFRNLISIRNWSRLYSRNASYKNRTDPSSANKSNTRPFDRVDSENSMPRNNLLTQKSSSKDLNSDRYLEMADNPGHAA